MNVSLTAADSARMQISTSWSMPKETSCARVRYGPVTWYLVRPSANCPLRRRPHGYGQQAALDKGKLTVAIADDADTIDARRRRLMRVVRASTSAAPLS